MASANSSGERSPFHYLNDLIDHFGSFVIDINTNKEIILNAQLEEAEKALKFDKEKPITTLARNPQDLSLQLDVNLGPESLVDIITLTKSIDKVLEGKVFLCRVLVINALQMKAIALTVEDPAGERAIRVFLYNFPHHFSVFKVGTFIAIANPYFKATLDCGLALRSDKASEVTILNKDLLKARFPDVVWKSLSKTKSTGKSSRQRTKKRKEKLEFFKRSGNEFFVEGNNIAAIASYTEGLSLFRYDEDLLSNRAACFLKVENYRYALRDASLVLEKNTSHVKAIYRAAKAHIGLKEYDRAKELLEEKLQIDVPRKDLEALLKSAKEYIAQRDFGQYDMAKFHVSMGKAVVHDVADYVGPVRVADVGSKGRGLVVTEDVQPGQLLSSTKAFGVYFSTVDETGESRYNSEQTLLNIIQHKITTYPEISKEFYSKTAGSKLGYLSPEKDDYTTVDVERVKAIIRINGLIFDIEKGHGRGLWILSSYLNNDCFNCNASVTLFGDVFQVRCLKPMKVGDEILISYLGHSCSLRQRKLKFQEMDFVCKCDRCLYESREPRDRCIQRDALLEMYHDGTIRHPKKLKQLLKKLKELSKESPFADHYVALPRWALANSYFDQSDGSKAIATYEVFVADWEKYGGDLTTLLYRASSQLFHLYFAKCDKVNAKRWRGMLRDYVRLKYGFCDDSLLENMYPGITIDFALVDA